MKRHLVNILSALAVGIFVILTASSCSSSKSCVRMLVGSYGPAENDGVRMYEFNQQTGESHLVCGLRGIADPSYLAIAQDNRHFYCVSEEDDSTAALVAAEIVGGDESTSLRIINFQTTDGEAPCYVNILQQGPFAFTANYNGSSFTSFGIDKESGALLPDKAVILFPNDGCGTVKDRQEKSHIHCVEFTPDSAFLIVDDLGCDKVRMFALSENISTKKVSDSQLYENETDINIEPGSGPRHVTFAPNGKQAYLINELSGKVTVFDYNKESGLTPKQYAFCDSVGGQGSADIHISKDGRFLYASNRLKADGISIFRISKKDGTLTKVGYQLTGIHPRNFALSPNGKYLLCACRDSNVIQIYKRNARTGLLTPTEYSISMSKPVCVKFLHQ